MAYALDEINAAPAGEFVAALGKVFEDAPWVAETVAPARPFATVAALHEAMLATMRAAPADLLLAFLRGHPELAGAAAKAGTLGADSTSEQAGLGLERPADDAETLAAMNAGYLEKFGFPFIVCVRRHTRASVLSEFRRRLTLDAPSEKRTALREIAYITRLRLVGLVDGPGAPVVNGSLTTHVLDTSRGRPAANVAMELFEVGGGQPALLATGTTNAEGHTDQPLLEGEPLRIGCYELRFDVGRYYSSRLAEQPPFLGVVPIRFSISEPETHYHIPLLVSPGGYSTYRGS